MIRSLYTGVSGLKNFQTEMDVISDNIANVSTTAFKRSRVSFESMFSQTLRHGQQAFGDYGGLNPMQVGLGAKMASIDVNITQGPTETTGKNTDIAIEGEGFLVVKGYDGTNYYTRDGNLNIGTNYDLVMTNSGYKVQGWLATQDPVTGNLVIADSGIVPENLNLATYLKKHARQTSNVTYSCNLDASSDERDITMGEEVLTFLDSNGKTQQLTFKFKKIDANHWLWTAYDDTEGHVATGSLTCDDEGKVVSSAVDPAGALSTAALPYFTYDPDGDPQPAMVTSPEPSGANSNYNSGKAGNFSSIQLTDSQVVTEDIQVIFDGGSPDHATSYRVVGSERGFIGSGTLGGSPARIEGEAKVALSTGVWTPTNDTSFTIHDGYHNTTTATITFTNAGGPYTTEKVAADINAAMATAGVRATAYFDSTLGKFQIVSNSSGSNRNLSIGNASGSLDELGLDGAVGNTYSGQGASKAEMIGVAGHFGAGTIQLTTDLSFTLQDTTGNKALITIKQMDTATPAQIISYNASTILAEINTALKQNGLTANAQLVDSDNDGILDQLKIVGGDTGSGESIEISLVSGNLAEIGLGNGPSKVFGTAGTSTFSYGGISFTLVEGDDVWAPNDSYSFTTTASKGEANSVKIYVPQPNQDVIGFKTSVVDTQLGIEKTYKIEGSVSEGALHSTSITIYDSLGTPHNVITTWEHRDKNSMEWSYTISYAKDDPEIVAWLRDPMNNVANWEDPSPNDLKRANDALITNREGMLYFDGGNINTAKSQIQNFQIKPAGSNPMSVAIDTSLITQFSSDFTTKAEYQDGYEMGLLEDIYIEDDGTVRGVYSNGQKQPIAMIAIATFNNPCGLESEGGNIFSYSPNSGLAIIRRPGVGSAGVIKSGVLEMSNVDISEEFTSMIITQRAFQANSRVITTADEMLQELVNLKR